MSGEEWPRWEDHRAAWILNRYGWALFQRRRGEEIRKRMWEIQRVRAGANPSQYTEVITAPLHERSGTTVALWKERLTVLAGLVFLPFGWLGGKLLYKALERLVPEKAAAYPITPLSLAGGALSIAVAGLAWCVDLTVLRWLYVPYLLAQFPGVFFMAALYGILEGWLGVPGSTEFWPEAQKPIISAEFEFLRPDVLNPPPVIPQIDADKPAPFRVPAPPKSLDIFRSHKPKR